MVGSQGVSRTFFSLYGNTELRCAQILLEIVAQFVVYWRIR
jgi:hypothetical protein